MFKAGNSKRRLSLATVLVFCMFSYGALHIWKFHENILKTVFNLQSGHNYMVEIAMFNVQRAITPKEGNPELWFMCSTHCLLVLYIDVKFRENVSNGIRVMERTRNYGKTGCFQYLRCSNGCNSKSRLTRELWFLCSARRLIVIYICVRFGENI